jgi:protein ImuA
MARHAVARETVFALRREIARIEGRLAESFSASTASSVGTVTRRGAYAAALAGSDFLKTGVADFDAALGGGLPKDGLSEFHGAESRNAAAVAGFVLGLLSQHRKNPGSMAEPFLWIASREIFREAGMPYAVGLLQRFGLPPDHLLFIETAKPEDALWAAEEAAGTGKFSTVLLELGGATRKLDLVATQRLHRRAMLVGRPVFLLRQSAHPVPTAAPVRLTISPAPAALRQALSGPLAGSIGPPAFKVTVSKTPISRPADYVLEWNPDDLRFEQRTAQTNIGSVVSAPRRPTRHASATGTVLAIEPAGAPSADRQPSREQYATRLRAG